MTCEAAGKAEDGLFWDRFQDEPGIWRSYGPYGGEVLHIEAADASSGRVYAAFSNGIYASADLGLSWTDVSAGIRDTRVRDIAVDPVSPSTVYVAAGTSLYKSTNAGQNWQVIKEFEPLTSYRRRVLIDIDPDDPARIVVSAAWQEGLYESLNGGNTWTRLDDGSVLNLASFSFADDDRTIMIATGQFVQGEGLAVSSDGGHTWDTPAYMGAGPRFQVTKIDDGVVIAVFGARYFLTTDFGDDWSSGIDICPELNLTHLRYSRIDAVSDDGIYLVHADRLIRSDHQLENCELIDVDGLNPNLPDAVNSVTTGDTIQGDPQSLIVGTLNAGVYYSTTRGADWERRNQGLTSTNIRAVTIHPQDEQVVYAGYGDSNHSQSDRLWRSVDGGHNWVNMSEGLDATGVRDILLDAGMGRSPSGTHVYAVGGGWADEYHGGSGPDELYMNSGVFKSLDGGQSWAEHGNGIHVPNDLTELTPGISTLNGLVKFRSIVADHNSADPETGLNQIIYVAGNGYAKMESSGCTLAMHRIYKSSNAGEFWTPADDGLPFSCDRPVSIISLVIDPTDSNTLYTGTTLEHVYDEELPYPSNGFYKSVDGGASWTLSSSGLPLINDEHPDTHWSIFTIAIAPSNPNVLYLSATDGSVASAICKSLDGGETWSGADSGLPENTDIRSLVVDPSDSNIVFASNAWRNADTAMVYRTIDGGESWHPYGTVPWEVSGLALALREHGSEKTLYVGSSRAVQLLEYPDSSQ